MKLLDAKPAVQPQMLHILVAAANVAHQMDLPVPLVITSGIDGTHSPTSLHYALRALDFRTKTLTEPTKTAFINKLKYALGDDYDVILEHKGRPNEHLHVEYDP